MHRSFTDSDTTLPHLFISPDIPTFISFLSSNDDGDSQLPRPSSFPLLVLLFPSILLRLSRRDPLQPSSISAYQEGQRVYGHPRRPRLRPDLHGLVDVVAGSATQVETRADRRDGDEPHEKSSQSTGRPYVSSPYPPLPSRTKKLSRGAP